MTDICNNPKCPHRGKVRAMAFKGEPFCCDECKRAAGADVSSVGTYMFLTTEEAALIRARRKEAEETPVVTSIMQPDLPSGFSASQMGHPGGHYG